MVRVWTNTTVNPEHPVAAYFREGQLPDISKLSSYVYSSGSYPESDLFTVDPNGTSANTRFSLMLSYRAEIKSILVIAFGKFRVSLIQFPTDFTDIHYISDIVNDHT